LLTVSAPTIDEPEARDRLEILRVRKHEFIEWPGIMPPAMMGWTPALLTAKRM